MKRRQDNKKKHSGRKRSGANAKFFYFAFFGALVGGVLVIAALAGTGGNPAPEIIPGGSLTTDRDFHNFGRISMRNGKVAHTFRLKNTGSEAALIQKLYTS